MKDRRSGISIVGDIPSGTHLCHFYQTREDLVDIVLPYLEAGLKKHELCVWITSEPLDVEDANSILEKAIKNYNYYVSEGQIKVLSYKDWYMRSGSFDGYKMFSMLAEVENQALRGDFNGLRVAGNRSWHKKVDWSDLRNFEKTIEDTIHDHKAIALCSYYLGNLEATEILDTVLNHKLAIIKREGNWEVIQQVRELEGSQRQLERALWWSEKRYRLLADNLDEVIWTVDTILYNQLTYISPSVTRLIGYTVEEAKAKKMEEVFTPESLEAIMQVFTQEVDTTTKQPKDMNISRALEVKMKHKDGSIVPVEVRATFLPSPGGASTEILVIARRIG